MALEGENGTTVDIQISLLSFSDRYGFLWPCFLDWSYICADKDLEVVEGAVQSSVEHLQDISTYYVVCADYTRNLGRESSPEALK